MPLVPLLGSGNLDNLPHEFCDLDCALQDTRAQNADPPANWQLNIAALDGQGALLGSSGSANPAK
jgi:hypothetical protein